MQDFDMWQEWNNYLLGRAEHLTQALPKICLDSQSQLCSLVQQELNQAMQEWQWLQCQKMASEWWENMMPWMNTSICFSNKSPNDSASWQEDMMQFPTAMMKLFDVRVG